MTVEQTSPPAAPSTSAVEPARWIGSTALALIILAAASILAMGRLLGSELFEIDDPVNISINQDFASPTVVGIAKHWMHPRLGLYMPVTYTVWHVIAMLTGYATPDALGRFVPAWPYKAANLVVHVTCAALAFALFRRWLSWRANEASRLHIWLAAICGALVIAVHPVQVETIAWGSGMKDLLMTAFSLAALLYYARSVEASIAAGRPIADWKLHGTALAMLLCGMLSKPTAMVVPVLLIAIDAFVYRRSWRSIGIAVAPFLPIAVGLAALARHIQPSMSMTQIVSPLLRPLLATDAIAFYLAKLVWPQTLAFDYGRTQHVALAGGTPYWSWAIVLAIAGAVAWLAWKRRDARWLPPMVLFVVPLGPVLGLVAFDYMDVSAVGDHYLALPIVGAGLFVAMTIHAFSDRTGALRLACGVALVAGAALAVRSNLQSAHWRDAPTYYAHALRVNPNSWQAMSVWSNYLYNQTLTRADKLTTAQLRAEFEESAEFARRAIAMYQDRPGMAEIKQLRPRSYPRAVVDHFRLALMDQQLADRPDTSPEERRQLLMRAQKNVTEAFSANGEEPIYWRFAVRIYIKLGNSDLAERALKRLRELEPEAGDLDDLAAQIRRIPATQPTTGPAAGPATGPSTP